MKLFLQCLCFQNLSWSQYLGVEIPVFSSIFPLFFLTKWVIYNFINQITYLRLSQTISFRLNCHTFFFFLFFHRTFKNVQDKFPLAVSTPNIIHMLFHVPFLHVYLFLFLFENLPYWVYYVHGSPKTKCLKF